MKKYFFLFLFFYNFTLLAQSQILKIGPSGLITTGNNTILNYGIELGGEWKTSKHWSFGTNGSLFKSAKYEEINFINLKPTKNTLSDEAFGFEPYARRYSERFEDGSFWGMGLDIRSLNTRNHSAIFKDTHTYEQYFTLSFGNRTKMTESIYCDQLLTLGISGDSPMYFKFCCFFGFGKK